jgi:hypothetical protein
MARRTSATRALVPGEAIDGAESDMPASEAGHEPDAAVLAGQLRAAQLETDQLKRELVLAQASHGKPQPAARRVPSPKRVTLVAPASGARAEGKKPAAAGAMRGDDGDDADDGDDGDDSDDAGGGGGGGSGRSRRSAPPSDSSGEDDEDAHDVDLFGDDTLSAPGASHGAAMYNGNLLGCEYDPNNPFPRIQGPLRTRTSHYLCRTAGDQLNAEVQDARTPDGKFALGEGMRRELSTHIPTLSYLQDLGTTFSALSDAVQAGQHGGREAAVETLAVAGDALKACIQQQRAISHFILERVDEIEQRALGDRTTAAQFDPFYRPQRVRSEFGAQMLERAAALEHRSLASIGARARARAAAGTAPTASAGRGADGARARRALAAKLHGAAGAKGGAPFGAQPEGSAKAAEGGKAKGAKGGKGAGRGGGRG